jgi:hypothetical protein
MERSLVKSHAEFGAVNLLKMVSSSNVSVALADHRVR